jgi:chemotaxis protein methyltransferase CheR
MLSLAKISEADFGRLSRLITSKCGIRMPATKKTMVQGRLQKRIRQLKVGSIEEYCEYLFSPDGKERELDHMIDAITTNKTDFFREPAHFEYLVKTALPEVLKKRPVGLDAPLKLWSAGCSTGEEPYTLAMVLNDFAEEHDGFKFSIFATDISMKAIEAGRLAVYRSEKVEPVPFGTKKKYLLKSRDSAKMSVRVVPKIREKVKFWRLNLAQDYTLGERMDAIFFRNVMIYFDRDVQEALLGRLIQFLRPGGYLFVGHSETLNGMDLPLRQVAPATYRKE